MPYQIKFSTSVFVANNSLWVNQLLVPEDIALDLKSKNIKRFRCKVKTVEWQCSVLQDKGLFYIMLNKNRYQQFNLSENEPIEVTLTEDNSEYGIDMPVVLEKQFINNQDAFDYFGKLSPGKQRTLIYLVAKVKSEISQLKKANAIIHHLIETEGNIDFKRLNEVIKQYNQGLL